MAVLSCMLEEPEFGNNKCRHCVQTGGLDVWVGITGMPIEPRTEKIMLLKFSSTHRCFLCQGLFMTYR